MRFDLSGIVCAATLAVAFGRASVPESLDAQQAPGPTHHDRKLYPHEPDGFVRFAENDASEVPHFPNAPTSLLGTWYAFPAKNPNLTVERDPDAPVSPPFVLSSRYPRGMKAGIAPVNWGGWEAPLQSPSTYKSKLYISLWIKIRGQDFENNKGGTKAGFIGVGNRTSGHAETVFWLDNGEGRQRAQGRFVVLFKQQAIVQPNGWVVRNLGQNARRDPVMTAGTWHQWEAVLELNDMGRANGVFRMWIDGIQTHDFHDVTYVTPKGPIGFNQFKWNPTWGGQGGFRTRDDSILIDHVYLSGVPQVPVPDARDPR